jgi:hypothetical protein
MQNVHLKYDTSSGLTNGQIIKFYVSGVTSGVTSSIIKEEEKLLLLFDL